MEMNFSAYSISLEGNITSQAGAPANPIVGRRALQHFRPDKRINPKRQPAAKKTAAGFHSLNPPRERGIE
jgi:hypothetical protein